MRDPAETPLNDVTLAEIALGGEKSFIGGWLLPDISVCDELIAYFHQREDQKPGQIGHQGVVDKSLKDSTDVVITLDQLNEPVLARYLSGLRAVSDEYSKRYQAARMVERWGITESINIQHYAPGGGYKEWHTERIGKALPGCNRHLVFMTYLNDVTDHGGTDFYHQKISAPARKGLTLIWPSDWTHLHRGAVSPTQEKYIITGWFDFI